jgi:UDP-N-acetylglucosamine acyltransferase
LADGVSIGPHVVVEEHVTIGKDTRVMALSHLKGHTTIGCNNTIHTGAVIGEVPQDLSFKGKISYVSIGNDNTFRENVTIHRGTKPDSLTVIGNHNLFMVNSHVAHNNMVGNHVIMVNNSVLAGYVEVQDYATIGAYCSVHQFCRVGKYAFMRGYARSSRDVPPYCIVEELHTVRSLNLVGLKRAGFSEDSLRPLKQAFRLLFRSDRNLKLAMERVEQEVELSDDVKYLLDFIKQSKRGVAVGKKGSSVPEE